VPFGGADVVYGLERSEAIKGLRYLKPGGLCIANLPDGPEVDIPAPVREAAAAQNLEIVSVDALGKAMEKKAPMIANIVLAGAAATHPRNPFTLKELQDTITPASARRVSSKPTCGRSTPARRSQTSHSPDGSTMTRLRTDRSARIREAVVHLIVALGLAGGIMLWYESHNAEITGRTEVIAAAGRQVAERLTTDGVAEFDLTPDELAERVQDAFHPDDMVTGRHVARFAPGPPDGGEAPVIPNGRR
jgi:hypothetical protein